jgi:hypothetical protein
VTRFASDEEAADVRLIFSNKGCGIRLYSARCGVQERTIVFAALPFEMYVAKLCSFKRASRWHRSILRGHVSFSARRGVVGRRQEDIRLDGAKSSSTSRRLSFPNGHCLPLSPRGQSSFSHEHRSLVSVDDEGFGYRSREFAEPLFRRLAAAA